MDSYEQLAIRACKRLHSDRLLKRLRRIYARRIAISEESVVNECLFTWLINVAGKFDRKVDMIDMITNSSPVNSWKFSGGAWVDYWERFIFALASFIRLMEVHYIPGYKAPSYFRQWKQGSPVSLTK